MNTDNKPGASFMPDNAKPKPPQQTPIDTIPEPKAPETDVATSNKRRYKIKTILIALISVLLLGGAGTYAYLGIYVPNQPDAIVAEAFNNLLKADSFTFEGTIAIDAEAGISNEVDVSGLIDIDNTLLDLRVGLDVGLTTVNLDFRAVDDKFYFKLSGLDGLDQLIETQLGISESGPEFSTIISSLLRDLNDTWYEAPESLLESSGLELGDGQATKNLAEIDRVFNEHQFITVKDVLADEDINGKPTYHALVFINKDELKAAIDELESFNLAGMQFDQDSKDDFYKELDKLSDEDLTFEAWVYKDGRNIAQLKVDLSSDDNSATLTARFDNFNQSVNISAPDGAKNMIELYNSVLPLLMGSLDTSGLEGQFNGGFEELEGYDLEDLPSFDSELIPTVLGTFKDL